MDDKPYTLGTWRTLITYRCRYCPFDSTEETVALAHYQERHAPRPRNPQPIGLAIADKSGREVWSGEAPAEEARPPEEALVAELLAAVAPKRRKRMEA